MKYVVNMENSPVIFPKLTMEMLNCGENVKIVGKREADTKLAAILFAAAFDMNQSSTPDVMYYDVSSKVWNEIFLNEEDSVELCNKGKNIVTLKHTPVERTSILNNIIRNFVTQFSSATLTL